MQHFSSHLRRLDNNSQSSSKTTYVGRLAAMADAPRVPIGKEVVLLRLGRTLFLQYNRAKGFHRQTGTPNSVTIVYAKHEEDSSTRVATLQVGDVYEHNEYPRLDEPDEAALADENVGLVVALCRVGVDGTQDPPIDYAELVIQWRNPLAPKAADLNLALCNIRNDRSAPVLNFGVTITGDGNGGIPASPDDTSAEGLVESPANNPQTALLVLGVVMAAVGIACLAASAYLVLRQWHTSRQGQIDDSEYLDKSREHPSSPDTVDSKDSDIWEDTASPSEREQPTIPQIMHDVEENSADVEIPCESLAVSPRREWWEEIVESLRKIAFKEDQQ